MQFRQQSVVQLFTHVVFFFLFSLLEVSVNVLILRIKYDSKSVTEKNKSLSEVVPNKILIILI